MIINNMKLNWHTNFHRLSDDEKARGEKPVSYPDEDGVYVIGESIGDKQVARYVGKGNISKNISAHKDDNEENEELKDLLQNRPYKYRINYALVSDETDMANAEYTLFTHYGGVDKLYNKITPEGVLDQTVTPPF